MQGAFLVDDIQHLSLLNLQGGVTDRETFLAFVFGNHSGATGRPLSMFSFLLNDNAFPGDIASYRFTNIMIHCLVGILIFIFSQKLLVAMGEKVEKACWVSVAISSWWLLIPINVSTTLYVIQRMTQLSTLFTLLGLIFYLKGRAILAQQALRGWFYLGLGLLGFGLLAVLSKENGILIFAYALVCELSIGYSKGSESPRLVRFFLLLPLLLGFFYLISSWESFSARYQYREFTVYERLLTQSRILWDYIYAALIPFAGNSGLIHDDYQVSKSIFTPISTALSIALHIAVLAGAYIYRKKMPILFLGVFWFYSGHLLESTVIPLELYYEHRNYLPILGVLTMICVWVGAGNLRFFVRVGLVFVIITLSSYFTYQRAKVWGNPELQTVVWAIEHPDSIRAQTDYVGLLLRQQRYEEAFQLLSIMNEVWPAHFHINLLLIKYQCLGLFPSGEEQGLSFASEHKGVYSGNLHSALRGLMATYRSVGCYRLNDERMLHLLASLLDLRHSRPEFNAKVHMWRSEFFAKVGDLDGAVGSIDRALAYRRYSIYYYYKALLLEDAGLYVAAYAEVKNALRVENRKYRPRRVGVDQYETLKDRLAAHSRPSNK